MKMQLKNYKQNCPVRDLSQILAKPYRKKITGATNQLNCSKSISYFQKYISKQISDVINDISR